MPRYASALVVLLLLVACRIEKHVPAGPVQEEEAIRDVVLRYYRGALNGDSSAVANALSDSVAVVQQDRDGWHRTRGATGWIRSAIAGPGTPGAEPTRIELKRDGDVASAWVASREPSGTSSTHFVLQRVGGAWEIVFIAIPAPPLAR
jgi:hypothetical protein